MINLKNKSSLFSVVILSFVLIACTDPKVEIVQEKPSKDHTILAVNYFQKAAEVRALQYQAFNAAKWQLLESLKNKKKYEKIAVVVDIDETVLDNSPYQARQVFSRDGYPTGWSEWVKEANAIAIPGAVEFMKWADQQGAVLFYVSNRKESDRAATIINLKSVGFPQVVDEKLLLRANESSKETRRKSILKGHTISVLIGDNLADFDAAFDAKSSDERNQTVDQMKDIFGKQFIMLPNSLYGDWEAALYHHKWTWSPSQFDSLRKVELRTK